MAAVVTIRVVQRDGCGFEVTQSGDDDRLPTAKPREEAALLAMAAMARALRQLQPENMTVNDAMRDLLRQLSDSDGTP